MCGYGGCLDMVDMVYVDGYGGNRGRMNVGGEGKKDCC